MADTYFVDIDHFSENPADVAEFIQNDPLNHSQAHLRSLIRSANTEKGNILVFAHDMGGGADMYLDAQCPIWLGRGNNVFILRYMTTSGHYCLNCIFSEESFKLELADWTDLEYLLQDCTIDRIIINELVTYPALFTRLSDIRTWKQKKKARLIMLIHDYLAVSPSYILVSPRDWIYAREENGFHCDRFYEQDGWAEQYDCPSIEVWRQRWEQFLLDCDEVRCFSEDSRRIMSDAYPTLQNITLVPHVVSYMPKVHKECKTTATLNIGVLGLLTPYKGRAIVRGVWDLLERENRKIKIILIGCLYEEETIPVGKHFEITGRYNVEDLPQLVVKKDVDLFLMPSIWPETFSYTTEEIIKMGMPIACLDLGAQAERVRNYEKGLVLSSRDPLSILMEICAFARELHIVPIPEQIHDWEEVLTKQEQLSSELRACKEQLMERERELNQIKSARSWRVMSVYWKLRDAALPVGSKRRLLVKLAVKAARHPVQFMRKCSPRNVSQFFRKLRTDGADRALNRLDDYLAETNIISSKLELYSLEESTNREEKTALDYEPLFVPEQVAPSVSIVIPVYNQFEYTYLCIKSIINHSGAVPYEIIVADDCSTDLTKDIDEVIKGLHTIHNPQNLRFLLNCNNAAKQARGKYILFLNNDTQVQENWLAPLVELIERSDDIGMVGSKLVYPDGRLQEAGGIVWKDGIAWNYGNRSDPDLPEFNYVKEVDYISGASILIRRTLWEEIGGFDERFVPAYYEDTDLAFMVRKRGCKVMYQPLSVVVHFEGVSNGTDTTSGQKSYQVENQKKFYEKWKNTLKAEHFPNGENVFQARDRSRNRETVLVIDHYIPTYDKDAGSRSMDTYLTLLVKMGFHVLFMGDNFHYDVHYARRYEQMGIEMLCGSYYSNWKKWMSTNAHYFDYVFLSRPHISIKYIDFFRDKTSAKMIYYVQDLHFLRETREYEITHDPALLKSAKKLKKQEMYIMGRSDVVFTLSDVEQKIIDQEIPGNRAVIIPISCYYAFPDDPVNLKGKRNIIFVGGFGHRPNEDGILWFLDEVWEQLHRQIPDSRLVIIGSRPTEKVLARQSQNVVVTGFVSDEELEAYYQSCRVCIIPLRYGAGVKGKTLEAMYHRVPIVSTSVGIEGLVGIERYIRPADDAEHFCEQVKELYQNDTLAQHIAESYYEYLRKNNSFETVSRIFASVFRKQ